MVRPEVDRQTPCTDTEARRHALGLPPTSIALAKRQASQPLDQTKRVFATATESTAPAVSHWHSVPPGAGEARRRFLRSGTTSGRWMTDAGPFDVLAGEGPRRPPGPLRRAGGPSDAALRQWLHDQGCRSGGHYSGQRARRSGQGSGDPTRATRLTRRLGWRRFASVIDLGPLDPEPSRRPSDDAPD